MELLFIILVVHYGSCNLIKNEIFQNTSESITGWIADGCELVIASDGGHHVIEANERRHSMDGPSQYVPLRPDSLYSFRVSVRQMNNEKDNGTQNYRAAIRYTWDNGVEEYRDIARQPEIHSTTGWFTMETAFTTPKKKFTKALLAVHGAQPGIIFHVANFTLDEVPVYSNWAEVDNQRIHQNRKNNVHFMFTLEPGMKPEEITVQIDHQRHLFGFGAMADTQRLKVTGSQYQKAFYSAFNWATINAFEWPTSFAVFLENTLQDKDTIPLLHDMKANGFKIRGQPFYQKQVPLWVDALPSDQLKQTMVDRVHFVSNVTKGLIDQWEIFSDHFEDTFFKGRFPEFDLVSVLLPFMHIEDPFPSLRINEMDVLVTGNHTGAYATIAKKYAQLGLQGIGAKSDFINSEIDPWLLKSRLDLLSKSGLPIWITDLDVHSPDEDIRATLLENALRVYFSHPDVEGITLKNFFLPNTAVGKRFLDLTQKEWSTHITRNLGSETAFIESCFQGTYDVRIFFNGNLVDVKPFTLDKVDTVFKIHLTSDMGMGISKPTSSAIDNPSTSTRSSVAPGNLIASAVSPATHLDLQCVTRWSKLSGPGDDETVDIGCHGDEVLTGCSSSKVDPNSPETHDWYHDGESIVGVNGSSVCRATNGFATKTGVYAVARCCSARDLSCQYLSSGPSQPAVGAIAETRCPSNYVATGCSGLQKALGVRGVSPNQDLSGCLAVDGEPHYGVLSAASCCSAPGLKCVNVTSSIPYATNSVKVTCEEHPGTVMTSCHAHSAGKIKGAYISDSPISACRVSGEEPGIEAVAVCCHVDPTITVLG